MKLPYRLGSARLPLRKFATGGGSTALALCARSRTARRLLIGSGAPYSQLGSPTVERGLRLTNSSMEERR
jgi:hypothetical protein